jgi:hypothetical protein
MRIEKWRDCGSLNVTFVSRAARIRRMLDSRTLGRQRSKVELDATGRTILGRVLRGPVAYSFKSADERLCTDEELGTAIRETAFDT